MCNRGHLWYRCTLVPSCEKWLVPHPWFDIHLVELKIDIAHGNIRFEDRASPAVGENAFGVGALPNTRQLIETGWPDFTRLRV